MSDNAVLDSESEIASLLMPITGKNLLLPSVSVAEVVPYAKPQRSEGMPPWFLGHIEWRNELRPVISFEQSNGEMADSIGPSSRLAMINSISAPSFSRMPFFALPLLGIPRFVRVTEEIISRTDSKRGLAELMPVAVGEERAVIPNLPHLEQMLLTVHA